MKALIRSIIAIISLTTASSVFAQGMDDHLSSVLQRARELLRQGRGTVLVQEDYVPWTPILISFTPGLSIPFGYYDTNLAFGAIGTLVRDVHGGMGSGVFNIAGDVGGFAGAGVFNITRDLGGLAGAGVFNIGDRVAGVQAAGVFNLAGGLRGLQAAGVFNQSSDMAGGQFAGVLNIAGRMHGVQAAGVFNYAAKARGLQVGLVNIADQMDGIQLGLLNIARDGVLGVGVAYEPSTSYLSAWWQNGTRLLYTVVQVEAPSTDLMTRADRLIVGAGLGTRLGGRYNFPYLDAELLVNQEIGSRLADWAQVFQDCDASVVGLVTPFPELRLRLGLPLARHLSVVGGLTVDFDLASLPGHLPSALRSGYVAPFKLFGEDITAYGRWFVGLKF